MDCFIIFYLSVSFRYLCVLMLIFCRWYKSVFKHQVKVMLPGLNQSFQNIAMLQNHDVCLIYMILNKSLAS